MQLHRMPRERPSFLSKGREPPGYLGSGTSQAEKTEKWACVWGFLSNSTEPGVSRMVCKGGDVREKAAGPDHRAC